MSRELDDAVVSVKAHRAMINGRFKEKVIPRIVEVLSSLKNLDDCYHGAAVNDDLDWLKENCEPWEHKDTIHWEQYIEHHWEGRLEDLISITTAICDAGELLEFRVLCLCDKIQRLISDHSDDVRAYPAAEREVVSFLEGAVSAVYTIVESPIEDPLGFYCDGNTPKWIRLVCSMASVFPI